MVVKGVQHSRINNERDVLLKFQNRAPLRRLLDEIVEPSNLPGIVLQHMNSDLLEASQKRIFSRAEIKHVARTVVQALTVLHRNGYVHTGRVITFLDCSKKLTVR